MKNIQLSTAPGNCNTYRITGDTSGEWVAGTWNISSYGGEQLYFFNMSSGQSLGNTIKAVFYINGTETVSEQQMTLVSGSSRLYSVTIPDDETYDTVIFKDDSGTVLDEAWVWEDKYNPDTNNTYYYERTVKSDGTVVSGFDVFPTDSAGIEGKNSI